MDTTIQDFSFFFDRHQAVYPLQVNEYQKAAMATLNPARPLIL